MSRREFGRRAAIGSAVASIAPTGALCAQLVSATARPPANQVPDPAPAASRAPAQAQVPANVPRLSPEGQSEAEARFQAILAQYGGRFTDEQRTDLRRLCMGVQPALERLRAHPLPNGEGSALYLKPLFEREKKPKTGGSHPGSAKPAASPAAPVSGATPKP